LNQSEPNVILTAHATKVNRPEPNWTEPQTCLAGRNHALSCRQPPVCCGQSPQTLVSRIHEQCKIVHSCDANYPALVTRYGCIADQLTYRRSGRERHVINEVV